MAWLKFDRIAGEGKDVSHTRRLLHTFHHSPQDPEKTMHYICNILLTHAKHIEHDPWRGLPELTNAGEWHRRMLVVG